MCNIKPATCNSFPSWPSRLGNCAATWMQINLSASFAQFFCIFFAVGVSLLYRRGVGGMISVFFTFLFYLFLFFAISDCAILPKSKLISWCEHTTGFQIKNINIFWTLVLLFILFLEEKYFFFLGFWHKNKKIIKNTRNYCWNKSQEFWINRIFFYREGGFMVIFYFWLIYLEMDRRSDVGVQKSRLLLRMALTMFAVFIWRP